ncbi:MAG: hydrogenase maturation nickel metallochaperone HypA [Bryobacteraceae bacterium]
MHELSIAMSIVDAAEEESARRGGACVSAVYLRLGALSGVVKEALLSSYALACEGTALQDSRLVIEELPVVVYCPTCRDRRSLPSIQRFCCPVCGTATGEVVQGKEIEVSALEIEELAWNPG